MNNILWKEMAEDYWWFIPLILAALIFLYEMNRVHGFDAMLLLLAGMFSLVTFVGWISSASF